MIYVIVVWISLAFIYISHPRYSREIYQSNVLGGRLGLEKIFDFPAKLYSYTGAGQVREDFGKIYVWRKVFRVGRIRYSTPAARFLQTMPHLSSRAQCFGMDIKTLVELYKSFNHCTPGTPLQLVWGQQTDMIFVTSITSGACVKSSALG